MKSYSDISLKEYTTIKIGGIAKQLFIPESVDELIDLVNGIEKKYIIGGGSNLLINDNRNYENVIVLKDFNNTLIDLGNGNFKVGASVRLQSLIRKINDYGYGGIEYLYSVPGLVGGAVVMNAGRGINHNKYISDYITEVEVLHENKIKVLKREECKFEHRNSIFKNGEYIILSVEFSFEQVSKEESTLLRKERMENCKIVQDNSYPSFGSVFSEVNPRIMKIFKKSLVGRKNNIRFSRKTLNWILNLGEGKYSDTIKLINRVKVIHKIFGKKCKTEVIIWD